MTITLYSNHCPRCDHLEALLKEAGISFNHITDVDLMLSRGFTAVPMLEVNGLVMDYPAAIRWLKERKRDLANQ